MESSPPYRTTESSCCKHKNSIYHHPSQSHNGSTKLRLMCSNGGYILLRPHDKSLRYLGGQTRLVVVDRHTTLPDLFKTLFPSSSNATTSSSFTLKYQLPTEDLDSLITVTTDEDLEYMIDEYESLNSSSSRLRLFIFPTNPESVSSSIGRSILEKSIKSEDWFLNALNGSSNSVFSDTSSLNCLLDLNDEQILISEKKQVCNKNSSIGRGNNSVQDVNSIPDSSIMETTSSFGSASSNANFPLIRLDADDHLKVAGGEIDQEQFSKVGVQKRYHDDPGSPVPLAVSDSPMRSGTTIQEHSDPFLLFHERSKHQQQQKPSAGFDVNSVDSILSDLAITDQSSPISQIQSSGYKNLAADPKDTLDQNTRNQMLQQQKIHNSSYVSSMLATQLDSPTHKLHHHQQQFIQPLQYIHHHPLVAAPLTSYYHHHHHHHPPSDQQNFMYYIPARLPPQIYNFPFQQPQPSNADMQHVTASPNSQADMKTELPVYGTTNSGSPQLVRVPSNVGYSQIHQPTQSI